MRSVQTRHILAEEPLDRGVPARCDVLPVVAAAARGQHASVPQAFGQLRELASRALVRRRREGKMGEWITGDAVSAALQHDELRREVFQMLQYLAPRQIKGRVIGPRRQRQIEFGTHSLTLAPLKGAAGARIKETPILVDVGEDQLRVALESVVEPIAMMGIDVDIGDTRETVMVA